MKYLATVMTILLATAGVAPAATATAAQSGDAYAGTHIAFDVTDDSIVDYSVNGDIVAESVRVQSQSDASAGGAADVGLGASAGLDGAGLALGAETATSATVNAESNAELTAHDNEHGILVVRTGGDAQYVEANLSGDAEAEDGGDGTVRVTTENGTEGSFIVVGEGDVTVNDEGNVSAELGEEGTLVFRSYSDGRDDNDDDQEQLIRDGAAAAEVYVMQNGEETVTDAVTYAQDTTVEAEQRGESALELTVDRAEHDGKIIITSVSEAAAENADRLEVTVDGEAAAEASSYSELEGAIGGDQSKYMVEQSANAETRADVLVAVNHFSERTIRMSQEETDGSSDDGDATTEHDDAETANDGGQPGFGVTAALLALLAAALLALRD